MKIRAALLSIAAALAFAPALPAQTAKPRPSPAAEAHVKLGGGAITIKYSAPSMRGRIIFAGNGLVPYGKVWRTGANDATSLVTEQHIKVGGADVKPGSYTLYSLPSPDTWKLIINKQTGQWGTKYDQAQDLARVDMQKKQLPSPQETMTISFENTTADSTELHIRWETTDVWVPVTPAP